MTMRSMPLLLAMLIAGCAHRPALPKYGDVDDAAALQILADRAHAVKSVAAEALITLTRSDGRSIRLEGALAMRPPHHARLRAWKFGQAVFDLTVTPAGLWLVAPKDPQRAEQVRSMGGHAGKLAGAWALLNGGFFDEPDLMVAHAGDQLVITRMRPEAAAVQCEVDRQTMTPRLYRILDEGGRSRFSLTLGDYRLIDGIAWPRRVVAQSDAGRIRVDIREPELNSDLPASAFSPPRRAEKLP